MTGENLSHYRILEKLGEGGMGVVYKAEDTKLRRTVALKFLPPHAVENRERFLREAQAAASLNHPNICTIYEIDDEHGFIAMEFIEGASVKEKIAGRPLPLLQALDFAIQTCAGLQAAHEKGVVHRDIKPGNLMLTVQGEVKITDFGLAQVGDRTRLTKSGMSLGTPAYMSPEQAQGLPADRRSDIWSIGVCLYEMVSGSPPFGGTMDAAVANSILTSKPEPLTALRAGLPLELDRIVAKALAKDPQERYQHVEELSGDLEILRKGSDSWKVARARKPAPVWRYVAILVGGIAIGAGITFLLTRRADSSLPQGATLTQLTTYSETERDSAISPDGKYIAFVSEKGGQPDIWVRQVIGGEPVKLTDDVDSESTLTYAPSGEWIYYAVRNAIWRIPALGGSPRKIVDGGGNPSFSSDGSLMAYQKGDTVELATSAGANPRKVGVAAGFRAAAALSPDGRKLALLTGGLFQQQQIFVSDTNGGTPRQVTHLSSGAVFAIAWMPDSRRVVYSHEPDAGGAGGNADLWDVPINGGQPRRITLSHDGRFESLRISADGARLSATLLRPLYEVWKAPLRGDPEANGKAAVRILDSSGHPMWIHAATPASMLLVNALFTGVRNLWTMPLDGEGVPRQITTMARNGITHASLSADGSRVAYSSTESGNAEIYVSDIDGSNLVQLTHHPAADFWPSWSHDGKWIAFGTLREGAATPQLWRIPSTGGQEVKLTRDGGVRGDWSPLDYRIVYYSGGVGDAQIAIIDSDGKTLLKIPYASAAGTLPVWSPDGRRFSVVRTDGTQNSSVWIYDAQSGEGRKAVQFPGKFHLTFRACWTKDGNAVVVNRLENVSNVVLLENFLP